MLRIIMILFVAISVQGGQAAEGEERRLALIIGNSDYRAIGVLANPANDASLIDAVLRVQGFETTLVLDASKEEMQRAVATFGRQVDRAGEDAVGLFYYAGHGIQADGRNFLVPVEAAPNDVMDLEIAGIEMNWVMRTVERAGNRTNIFILDACRNNPFVTQNRSASRGLARVNAPTGSFIAYATAPGSVAADGAGENSPFTSALAEAIATPGKSIEQVFKQVRVNVLQATNGLQTPWDSSSLVQDFYFARTPPTSASPAEQSLWSSISETGDRDRLALFLQVYPNSVYAEDARGQLAKILTADIASSAGKEEDVQVAAAPSNTVVRSRSRAEEADEFETARRAGTFEAYDSFLKRYPEGIFADLATMEMAELSPTAPEPDNTPAALIRFAEPITGVDDFVDGRSLAELLDATPEFPPIEGLDESLWKSQTCSFCHSWTPQALCDQGDFFAARDDASPDRIPHPYGGGFKRTLALWAAQGCN